METVAYMTAAYLAVQVLVALANALTRPVLRHSQDTPAGTVSVLIPARNEEDNIGLLLDDLAVVRNPLVEIIVYDDDSSDGTAGIVQSKNRNDQRIRLVRGRGLHPGWLGKNFACHSLAAEARGDYFLFLDADVRVDPNLIRDSVPFLERNRLDLLSIFPVQEMRSLGEWLTVPWMNRILLGNLPLVFIRLFRLPDFSAANGQFMLFRAGVYRDHQYHERVKMEKVEDIRIMRLMKRSGMRTHTLLSNGQVSCRMYRGFGGALSGFSKNVHAFFGKNWLILALYVFLTITGPFAVLYAFPLPVFFICMGGMLLFSALVARMSRQNVFLSLVLLPLQMVSLLAIALMAAYRQMTGQLYWKGRRIG